MVPEDWDVGLTRSLGLFLNGNGIQGRDSRGRRIIDVNFVVCFNGDESAVEFTVPPEEYARAWDVVVDTAGERTDTELTAGETLVVETRSLLVLQAHGSDVETEPDNSVSATLVAGGPGVGQE